MAAGGALGYLTGVPTTSTKLFASVCHLTFDVSRLSQISALILCISFLDAITTFYTIFCEGFWSRYGVERMFRDLCQCLADLFPEFLTSRTCIRFLVACIIELHGQLSSGVLLFVNAVRKIN